MISDSHLLKCTYSTDKWLCMAAPFYLYEQLINTSFNQGVCMYFNKADSLKCAHKA